MEALGINLGFFLFQVFNFAVLAVLLYAFAYKPLVNMLEQRKQKIAQGYEDAQVAAEARANAEKEAENVLADAQSQASQVIREATERAETVGREVVAEYEAEAAKAKEAALAEAAVERDRMLADVRGQIAALAMAAAQKLVGETLDENRQHALIDEFFSGVKAGKVVVLSGTELSGSSAEITSALPLTESEQASVKQDVLSKIGDQATVAFRVDPSILGGLIIRVGDKVIDNSVAGQLDELRQKLG
ncbi:MAG: F0F1 ATP synthase subunit B [Anaerolineales bacterium]